MLHEKTSSKPQPFYQDKFHTMKQDFILFYGISSYSMNRMAQEMYNVYQSLLFYSCIYFQVDKKAKFRTIQRIIRRDLSIQAKLQLWLHGDQNTERMVLYLKQNVMLANFIRGKKYNLHLQGRILILKQLDVILKFNHFAFSNKFFQL